MGGQSGVESREFRRPARRRENVDGAAGCAGFTAHVDTVGSDDEGIGGRQEIRVGIVAFACPQDTRSLACCLLGGGYEALVCPARRSDEEAGAKISQRPQAGSETG